VLKKDKIKTEYSKPEQKEQRESMLKQHRDKEKELENQRKQLHHDLMKNNEWIRTSKDQEAVDLRHKLRKASQMKIGNAAAIKARQNAASK
jgi:hypothetical protein